jgi:hypothetical protein
MNYCFVIIIIIFLYFCFKNDVREYFTSSFVVSSIDKRIYKVAGGFKNKNKAADKMAEINSFIVVFLKYMRNKFLIRNEGTRRERGFAERMLQNYNPDTIFENNPLPGEDTSFVVNKGDKFGICLREKVMNRGNIHDMNTLKFVILHELSHLGCLLYGHGYEFWSFFRFNLIQATEAGIYTPINYKYQPINYCGLPVRFNPYFNESYDWNIDEYD